MLYKRRHVIIVVVAVVAASVLRAVLGSALHSSVAAGRKCHVQRARGFRRMQMRHLGNDAEQLHSAMQCSAVVMCCRRLWDYLVMPGDLPPT
jgi:hypothetical protein